MSGFAGTLRGDGLARVHRTLDGLERDPLRLDGVRSRFSRTPPYTSNSSGTPTRSASPELPSHKQHQQRHKDQQFQRRRQLIQERGSSLPQEQFSAQVDEEMRRIWNTNPRTKWMDESKIPVDGNEQEDAIQKVKNRWIEQGIWKSTWDEMAAGRCRNVGRWKHEEPLELESESETDTEAEFPQTFSVFGVPQKRPSPKPRRPKSNDEKQRVAERQAIREREREASRPYHQFIYQISKEREQIKDKSANGEGADPADINTRAYENVKNTWTKRRIWNGRWGKLPGMLWKHEEPLEEETDHNPGLIPANALMNGSHDAGDPPTVHFFGSPSTVVSNGRQTSGIGNTSQQGPPADVDSTSLENGDAGHCPSASNPLRPRTDKRVLHPTTTRYALPPSRKRPCRKDGQPPVASASLGPVHSSKVSKATRKRRPGPQRQPNTSQVVSSDDLPLLSRPDTSETLPQIASIPPRRSRRLQPSEPNIAKVATGITSTDSLKIIARSRPKRKVAGNPASVVSAKPQGVSKGQRPSRTDGRARKR